LELILIAKPVNRAYFGIKQYLYAQNEHSKLKLLADVGYYLDEDCADNFRANSKTAQILLPKVFPLFSLSKGEFSRRLKYGGVLTGGSDSLLILVSINRLISIISQNGHPSQWLSCQQAVGYKR
jgi:hypothetical protein